MRILVICLYVVSLCGFVMGMSLPIMKSAILLGLHNDAAYLLGSVRHFFDEGDYFIGTIILLFSIIFPILKYLYVGVRIFYTNPTKKLTTHWAIEIINKWAMLDVFVVALVIVNMKFDSLLIKTELAAGTTYFAASIVLLMTTTFLLGKMPTSRQEEK